jgi:large subunit ribosomal protein L34
MYTENMPQTYNPKKRKRAKAHGFLSRSKSKNGKKVILKRRRKGRKKISV